MKRKVLLIDDHLPSRSLLAQALNKEGFEVVGEGVSGKASLSLAKATQPDAILMAVGLADLDGISAARQIMEENPFLVILVTSH
ncbi:MAG: response regulator, partial [Nitrososphaerales archaeon]